MLHLVYGLSYNQLLDKHRLSDTGTAKETNLTTACVWSKEIDDFDASDKHLSRGGLLDEFWRIGMDGCHLDTFDRPALVDRVSGNVPVLESVAHVYLKIQKSHT